MTAVFSACGTYRYTLERPLTPKPLSWLLWVMLNPSTADAATDDATIRRVIGFTRSWGYQGALVGNLYAFRATNPADLWAYKRGGGDIVGPENDEHINDLLRRASRVVIAWGAHASRDPKRAEHIEKLLKRRREVHALGFTARGEPLHPLRQPADLQLVRCES
ncbi:MAG TPA: DUF1643 domain-containing protein [Steroidobacter sp.]|uniref:DUF1643 domain-containing protein n=1 Tax=Steroidobacter sp. TaxID=1978227 RepID=UPI002EDB5A90